MDRSVVLGAALVLLGVVCVVIQIRWASSDRRKEEEAEAEETAALARGEVVPERPPKLRRRPDPWGGRAVDGEE